MACNPEVTLLTFCDPYLSGHTPSGPVGAIGQREWWLPLHQWHQPVVCCVHILHILLHDLPQCEEKNSASSLLMSFCDTSIFILRAGFVWQGNSYIDAPVELLDWTHQHVTTVVMCKIVRNERQMNLVNVIIVIEAKLRWVPIAAILSLRGIPGGPQIDLMLSGVSANYTSLSWVDLQWILWLGLPFLMAHGKT